MRRVLLLVAALVLALTACGGDGDPDNRPGADGAFGGADSCSELVAQAGEAYRTVLDQLGDARRTDTERIDQALSTFGEGPDLAVRYDGLECDSSFDDAVCRAAGDLRAHGPAGLTQEASTFCRRDVLRAICERLSAGADLAEIEGLTDRLLAIDDLVIPVTHSDELAGLAAGDSIRLADGRAIPARADAQRYSTHELLALEAEVIAAAARRQGDGAGLVPKQVVAAVLGQVQSGQLKALAVTGKDRFPAVPDVPTATESGLPSAANSPTTRPW